MRTFLAYLITFVFLFGVMFCFAGEPEVGYEKLWWFSIVAMSVLLMVPVIIFHMIQSIIQGDQDDSQKIDG